MCCRVSTPEAIEFRSKLGFNQHNTISDIKNDKIIFE